ncbi:hypothetical protein EXIGLDRAFT_723596 [Exidia glandulosa HHB12029]|uniref:Uncharacterized protein n=1 Tax=Exidia glandulosa HHB12029 TaxID=1314781 RepID=A0A165ESB7_EXIGL|nr:hypothetical protein EXIGLDRAFT_723596 [Exidia glandulosa HHB12029]
MQIQNLDILKKPSRCLSCRSVGPLKMYRVSHYRTDLVCYCTTAAPLSFVIAAADSFVVLPV